MKKYLLILTVVVLAFSSIATAASATFRVAADDVKPSYIPSDTITIELVADFYVAFLGIDYIYDSNSGTASSPELHDLFTGDPGTIVNSGGTLIEAIIATTLPGSEITDGEVLHSFEYHVPDVPDSTIIEITAGGVGIADALYSDSVTSIGALQLHVDSNACPGCPGDINQDNTLTLTDFFQLRAKIGMAKVFTGQYVITPNDPCAAVAAIWTPCGDINLDDRLDVTDFFILRGLLNQAKSLSGDFEILPNDPCAAVAALWPCTVFPTAMEGTASFRVAAGDAKGAYMESDTITIELVADFQAGFAGINYVYDSNSGTASSPDLHALFALADDPGWLINSGGTLIGPVLGAISGYEITDGVPIGEAIWSFEYHIPYVPDLTIIEIAADGVDIADAFYSESVGSIGALQLDVYEPCPGCPGDINQDDKWTLTDFFQIRGKLNQAKAISGSYTPITPNHPNPAIRALWDPCGDKTEDGAISLTDFFNLRGLLNQAKGISGAYEITPDDPCEAIRALWPCN